MRTACSKWPTAVSGEGCSQPPSSLTGQLRRLGRQTLGTSNGLVMEMLLKPLALWTPEKRGVSKLRLDVIL